MENCRKQPAEKTHPPIRMIVKEKTFNVRASEPMTRQSVQLIHSAEFIRKVILPYTQPLLAAIRETLIGNHLDASTKVEVKLPTPLSPTWVSRDFGPGIPLEQFREFYSLAGYSTKRNANSTIVDGKSVEVIGHKGIGRFAPLAVSNQFLVTNWNSGRKVTGQVFFDRTEAVCFDILSDTLSDEPTGVEIQFSLKVPLP